MAKTLPLFVAILALVLVHLTPPAAAVDDQVVIKCVYNSSPPTASNGAVAPVECDSTGSVKISGSVTATAGVQQASFTDKSGAVTAGGTAQTLSAINSSRKRVIVQNPCTAASQGIATAENLFI